MSYAAADLYSALQEAERRCRGMHGPTLTRLIDGWEAQAMRIDGRRFRRSYRSPVMASPVDALEQLVERIAQDECAACEHRAHDEDPCAELVRQAGREVMCGCMEDEG